MKVISNVIDLVLGPGFLISSSRNYLAHHRCFKKRMCNSSFARQNSRSTYQVPGSQSLRHKDILMNKTDKNPCSHRAFILMGEGMMDKTNKSRIY